jgi:hypothetical protein
MALPTDTTTNAGVAGAPYPCSLGGRPYMLDLSKGSFVERTIPLLRNQADTSGTVSEASLNPEDLVRRAWDSSHGGAGQRFRDKPDSDPFRFYTSEGIEVFNEKYQLTLSRNPAALTWGGSSSISALAGSPVYGPHMVSGGGHLLCLSGADDIRYYSGSAWSTVAGTPVGQHIGIVSDGYTVYVGYEQDGIYETDIDGGAASALFNTPASGSDLMSIGYAKGRLLCSDRLGNLYNPTDFTTPPNALPTALFTLPYGYMSHYAEGPNHIYMAATATSETRSTIYKTAVKPDGTALDVPTEAARLPDGETVKALYSYLGFLFIGISNGTFSAVRMAQPQGDGSLVIGPAIVVSPNNPQINMPMDGQDRYVFIGANNLGGSAEILANTERSGIMVLDLSYFTGELTPAWCHIVDIPATDQRSVVGLTAAGLYEGSGGLVFQTSGTSAEVYKTSLTNNMEAGEIRFGKVTYGVPDSKVAMYLDIDLEVTGTGSVTPFIIIDDDTTVTLGAQTASASIALAANTGKEFEVGLTLTRGATTTSQVSIKRVTLRSFINANRTREFILPLVVKPRVSQHHGGNTYLDTRAEIDAIAAMVGTVVVMKLGTDTEYVQVKDYQWDIEHLDEESGMFGGICMVKVQVVV